VLADSSYGNPRRTIVVGAHLDSVQEGPGLNDNGSGTATILEIAEELDELGIRTRNRVRFAFWGAEELGLIGSQFYVDSLGARQLDNIEANLNFDMVGSPNFVRFVYDGDGSDTGIKGPKGSPRIEDIFVGHFRRQGLETDPTAFDGRSDYGPFIAVGIPAGGLFTGAEGIKTEEQEAIYGGEAGIPYDPCYHQACDTIDNVNEMAIDQMSDGAAHTVLRMATRPRPL
jgi:Zn-dependent M28 family amino/carboxypeptidase